MMLFEKTRRQTVAVLGIAVLAGLLPLGGCSKSTTSSKYGTGDKRDDPSLKASMKSSMDMIKTKPQGVQKGHSLGGKPRG